MQFDRQLLKSTPKHLIQEQHKLSSHKDTALANQKEMDIATLTQPQALYITGPRQRAWMFSEVCLGAFFVC